MTLHPAPNALPDRAGDQTFRQESARYALLRRIAPALRHHMAGHLQPVGMISAILDRRLQAAAPDLVALRESSKSVSTLARATATSCIDLLSWIAPRENAVLSVQAGVEECVGMLATDLAFRGFSVVNQIAPSGMDLPSLALRSVFTAALIALTDSAPAPASVLLSSEPGPGHTLVRITLASEAGAVLADSALSYRKLGWDDVYALAAAERVILRHDADQAEMRFDAAPPAPAPA
jgi:hypothetical protein